MTLMWSPNSTLLFLLPLLLPPADSDQVLGRLEVFEQVDCEDISICVAVSSSNVDQHGDMDHRRQYGAEVTIMEPEPSWKFVEF
ncbi:hypothetical protein GBA52_023436 [Prunus armeniaca]|nr:hypothetical protein GBA52_023436 [Prunus armeniaca]